MDFCWVSLFGRSVWACGGVFCDGFGVTFDPVRLEMDGVRFIWKVIPRSEHGLEIGMFLEDLGQLVLNKCMF